MRLRRIIETYAATTFPQTHGASEPALAPTYAGQAQEVGSVLQMRHAILPRTK